MILELALAASASASCGFQNAREVQPNELMAAPEEWIGECVHLNGYVSGYTFFADVAGVYRFGAANRMYDPNQGWLGLYFDDQSDWQDRMRSASVVGRVNTCQRSYEAALAEADEDTLIMMIGYCHYRGGLTLNSVQIRAGSEIQFERQVGDQNRRSFGDLSEQMPPSMLPIDVTDLFDLFLSALRSGDTVLMGQIVDSWNLLDDELDRQAFVSYLAGRRNSPFSVMREAGPELQIAYFLERENSEFAEDESDQAWVGCFCVEEDCTGRWPISTIDATAETRTPYVCLRAVYEDHHVDGQHITGWALAADVSVKTLSAQSDN